MQMDGRLDVLLSALSEDRYIGFEELAKKLKLSQRTVRDLIKQLEEILHQHGASIIRRRGEGVQLLVMDQERYQSFVADKMVKVLPETGRQRMEFILTQLFLSDYVKAEDLCSQLYISRKTLSLALRRVEQYLNEHHLQLERKPYHGLHIVGKEFFFRLCLSSMFYEFNDQWFHKIRTKFEAYEQIRALVVQSVAECGYSIYEMELASIVLQIQVAVFRWKQGFFIPIEGTQNSDLLQEADIQVAQICVGELERILNQKIPIAEIKYIAIQFLGKKRVLGDEGNVFIDMEINQLVNKMIERVEQEFQLALYTDFDLNTSLRQHMVSLRIRLRYHISIANPILKEIKEEYSFPYVVAAHASTVLSEYFDTIVPEEEIGYLALCFALALERKSRTRCKRSILLVCASGVGSAKLFEYRFRELFGEYLSRVETCDIGTLARKDFSDIDYVFSTVPVSVKIPVPVCQVQYFFDRHNVSEMERILKNDLGGSIRKYFSPDLFFTDVAGETREAVLHDLCGRVMEVKGLCADFEACILERENLMQTDLCRHIAIPHPYKPVTEDTFISVAILEKPILWHVYEVQVVFLLSISSKKENLEAFYSTAPKFMMDEQAMCRLIEEKSYAVLMEIIDAAEQEY